MGYIIAIVVVFICVILFLKNRENRTQSNQGFDLNSSETATLKEKQNSQSELGIYMEMLPVDAVVDESGLCEIRNSKVLAHVNNLIPGLLQAGNSVNNATQAIRRNGEVLYRAIIPSGTKLIESKESAGAVRGIFGNGSRIQGHANFVAVKSENAGDAISNSTSAAMGLAAMVVGQYYMTQINDQLGEITSSIEKLSNYQDNEYRSRVFSLIAHVKQIAEFQVEILENSELRRSKILQLDTLELETSQLLAQANLTISGFTKIKNMDYKTYEARVNESQNWYHYQKSLLDVLYKISDLKYALHLGYVSREACTALLPTYSQQVVQTQTMLTNWHQETIERLNIDITSSRRKRDGLDKMVHYFPGLVKKDLKFRSVDLMTTTRIDEQLQGIISEYQDNKSELYLEDVQLLARDGKVYYVPETIDAH